MKRLCLYAAVLLAVSCVSEPTPNVDTTAPETVAAPVRKERIEEYKIPVVVKETVSFADGVVDRITQYNYDEGLVRLLSSVSKKPSTADPIERVAYEYSGGKLSSKSTYGTDGSLQFKSVYTYDGDGMLVREAVLDGKGLTQSVSEWSWSGVHKVSWVVLSASGVALAKTDYSYEGDRLASAGLFDGAGNSKGRITYTYDADGRPAAVTYYDAAGAQDGWIEYIQKDGRLAQESVYRADGRLERRLSYEYAPDGALVKKTLSDASGKPREFVVYENAYRTDTRTVVYYE